MNDKKALAPIVSEYTEISSWYPVMYRCQYGAPAVDAKGDLRGMSHADLVALIKALPFEQKTELVTLLRAELASSVAAAVDAEVSS